MRVLIVNTSEKTGGAAVAACRLAEALINNGVKAKMLVMNKQTPSLYVAAVGSPLRRKLNFLYERFVIWTHNFFHRRNLFTVSIADTGFDITETKEFQEADVIHLQWINQGMISLKGLRKILNSGKPIVWTMHDMWECTGICHYAFECSNYKQECGDCPFLRLPSKHDLSNKILKKKQKVLANSNVQFVAVSKWLADRARESTLLGRQSIRVIPNSISLAKFVLKDRSDARSELFLPDTNIIAFGAARLDTPIKGLNYLLEAISYLIEHGLMKREELHLVMFGGLKDQTVLQGIPVEYTYLGLLSDEDDLSTVYSAANVVVSSSLYETFGQTLIEAQACGCVPVSFNNSGQTDIIQHQVNGYLADYLSVPSLAEGIAWGINAKIQRRELRNNVVRKYSESVVAGKYIDVYNGFSGIKA
jgi:glycosyltransferase involved in cell wall biosynthesis